MKKEMIKMFYSDDNNLYCFQHMRVFKIVTWNLYWDWIKTLIELICQSTWAFGLIVVKILQQSILFPVPFYAHSRFRNREEGKSGDGNERRVAR